MLREPRYGLVHVGGWRVWHLTPRAAGTDPSQGTELCTIVETMFSLVTSISAFGLNGTSFADRLEMITFNALPGAMDPVCHRIFLPSFSDGSQMLWDHVYLEQTNHIRSGRLQKFIYVSDGV